MHNQLLLQSIAQRVPLVYGNADQDRPLIAMILQNLLMFGTKTNHTVMEYKNGDPKENVVYFANAIKVGAEPELFDKLSKVGSTMILLQPPTIDGLAISVGDILPPISLITRWLKQRNVADFAECAKVLDGLPYNTQKMLAYACEKVSPRQLTFWKARLIGGATGLETLEVITGMAPHDDLRNYIDQNYKAIHHDGIHPDLYPRGLLLNGQPGVGKTASAMIMAERFDVPLYRLDIAAMLGRYVGDTETRLEAALRQADRNGPCILLLDEVEKLITTEDDSGVMQRVLGRLLWWLQERQTRVIVIMTTNDVSKVPDELYREGRLDGSMTLGPLSDKAAHDLVNKYLDELGYPASEYISVRAKVVNALPSLKTPATLKAHVRSTIKSLL